MKIVPAALTRRQASADEFVVYLAEHVAYLQVQAVRLQSAGLRYGTIVVPKRFSKVVDQGEPTLLGRKVIVGDVERIGVLVDS